MLRGLRQEPDPSTQATLAAMWIAVTLGGHQVEWDTFNPVVFAVEWEVAPPDPLAGGGAPAPESGFSTPPPESAASLSS